MVDLKSAICALTTIELYEQGRAVRMNACKAIRTLSRYVEQHPLVTEGATIVVGPHTNGQGFYARIDNVLDEVFDEYSWERSSHGHTREEAFNNALRRLHGESETSYKPKDFGI